MSEDSGFQPLEAPPAQTKRRIVNRDSVSGFFCALAGTVVVDLVAFSIGAFIIHGMFHNANAGAFVFVGVLFTSGPITGILFWLLFRSSRPQFASGALAYAIVAFVLSAMSLSSALQQ